MTAPKKSYSVLAAIAMIFAAAIQPSPASAQSSNIEVSMARLRRLLHIPRISVARSHRREIPFASIIRRAADANGIDPALLAALVRVESNFNPRAVSHAGAQGLGQLMPATGRELGVVDPFDPHQNLHASARYLAEQLRVFRAMPLALAAYNAGPARVERGQIPASTRRYVETVLKTATTNRKLGFP